MNSRQNDSEEKRLKILEEDEIQEIYGRPCFTQEERSNYFSLSQPEKELMQILRSVKSKVYFILQLGYFKVKHLFFTFDPYEVPEDFQYILNQYFGSSKVLDMTSIDKSTRLKQQKLILQLFNYRSCEAEERQNVEAKAFVAVSVCCKPIYIFRELMNYLSEQHIVVPGYSYLQETVSKSITYEQNRLILMMSSHLKQHDIKSLKQLIDDSPGLYEITQLKHEPRDFSAGEIKREIQRGKHVEDLYQLAQRLLPQLDISNESIKYHASLVGYYSVYKLKRLNEWVVYLYILCFVYNRYQQVNDNLINTLIYNVRKYNDEAKNKGKEKMYECHVDINQNLKKAGQVLKIFTDDTIEANTTFHDLQAKAFAILERNSLLSVVNQILVDTKLDETCYQWEYIDKISSQFKLHLRPILQMVNCGAPLTNEPLIEAINFLKMAFQKGKALGQYSLNTLPTSFIPENVKSYIYEQGSNEAKRLLVNRYEFLIYRLIRNGLESGDIFCSDSIRFRSFEDDLIDDQQWMEKERLIADFGLTKLNKPIHEHLAELETELEKSIVEVNQRISSGENNYIVIKKHGVSRRWSLPYPSDTETTNKSFFDGLKPIEISDVLKFTDQNCNFIDSFEHILGRYSRHGSKDTLTIIACIIAWGTNMGIGRMSEISDINYSLLSTTSDNFIRLETLKEANDRISNAIAKLSIFRYYDINEVLHSSSDGQKIETGIDTINARHSSKYFGLGKGISECTLVINHIPVNAKFIGSNDHESHFVFDILSNNTTDIQPDVHSTDTHGTNEVNFAILYMFGYQFAPRYKDIYDKVNQSLYGFKHPTTYDENNLIKPVRKINTELIIEEWENIKRIMVSLALKTTTQSVIIKKLSSYARKNKTKRALWEYDNIHKSLYLLKFIDSEQLRKNVQKALNRGESYHKLRKAVSYANFGKLRFKTEQEQHIWGACSRLISNCIIFYNASILSKFLDYNENRENNEVIDMLKKTSPVAWANVNLYGRYEFNKQSDLVNMDEIVQHLARVHMEPKLFPNT
jgi:TnpA family transposase